MWQETVNYHEERVRNSGSGPLRGTWEKAGMWPVYPTFSHSRIMIYQFEVVSRSHCIVQMYILQGRTDSFLPWSRMALPVAPVRTSPPFATLASYNNICTLLRCGTPDDFILWTLIRIWYHYLWGREKKVWATWFPPGQFHLRHRYYKNIFLIYLSPLHIL